MEIFTVPRFGKDENFILNSLLAVGILLSQSKSYTLSLESQCIYLPNQIWVRIYYIVNYENTPLLEFSILAQ